MSQTSSDDVCHHDDLQVEPSPHATVAGFQPIHYRRRLSAAGPGINIDAFEPDPQNDDAADAELAQTFPAPVVLPEHHLAVGRGGVPQTLQAWRRDWWSKITDKSRKTIYVVAAPVVSDSLGPAAKCWSVPVFVTRAKLSRRAGQSAVASPAAPGLDDVIQYLRAFFHGMAVEKLSLSLELVPWLDAVPAPVKVKEFGAPTMRVTSADGDVPYNSDPHAYIGLRYRDGCACVRTRASPDGAFQRQLNVHDLLRAVNGMAPSDALAVLLLTDQDLGHKDCGSCVGWTYLPPYSVGVMSTARLNPALLPIAKVDLQHIWPASHCRRHVDSVWASAVGAPETKRDRLVATKAPSSAEKSVPPLRAAVDAVSHLPLPKSREDLYGFWLSRVAFTASHELCHGLGMTHCVYYACCMQATRSHKDCCQRPPYLCPICLRKLVASAQDIQPRSSTRDYVVGRYRALLEVCARWRNVAAFAGYGAWLTRVLSDEHATTFPPR